MPWFCMKTKHVHSSWSNWPHLVDGALNTAYLAAVFLKGRFEIKCDYVQEKTEQKEVTHDIFYAFLCQLWLGPPLSLPFIWLEWGSPHDSSWSWITAAGVAAWLSHDPLWYYSLRCLTVPFLEFFGQNLDLILSILSEDLSS